MEYLANRWAGRLYGTNTGNVFIELSQTGDTLSGKLRINDPVFGVSVYDYTGTFTDTITLNCIPSTVVEGVGVGNVTVTGSLTQKGSIEGEWVSTIGTAGTFHIFPHDSSSPQYADAESSIPEQVYNKTIEVGSVRLFKADILQVIDFIKKDFSTGKVVITYNQRGSELTKYADDFLVESDSIQKLNYLKIVIQEPEAHGINRIIVIDLVANGNSEIRVSGINESWVLGKAMSVYNILKINQNFLVTTYKKYGLNLNSLIFYLMLVVIPDIVSLQKRAIFVTLVLLLLTFLFFIYNKLIPNTVIYLQVVVPNLVKRVWPSVLSWVIAVSSSFVAAYIFSLLRNGNS